MADRYISPDQSFTKARARWSIGILLLAAVTSCAGRSPQPVAVVQPQDRYADCPAIFAEVQANNKKIEDLAGDQGGKVAQNVAAGLVGIVIWPMWFAMDFQGTAGKEIDALNNRQQYLATLAAQRNCAAPVAPPPVAATQPVASMPSQQLVAATQPVASMPSQQLVAATQPVASMPSQQPVAATQPVASMPAQPVTETLRASSTTVVIP
jgi:hypothetical protein